MNEQLQLLVNLQDIDHRIRAVEDQIAKIPLEIGDLQKEMEIQRDCYEITVKGIEDTEKGRRKKEGDLEAKESGLAKLKSQLLSVKTNREYQALLHEIENMKKEISELEEEILLLIEEGESAREQMKKANIALKEAEKSISEHKRKKEGELGQLLEEKRKLDGERHSFQQQISQELLKKYNKIREYRNGLAVVSVKDGSCQGCFMSLMPQLFQEVKYNMGIYECPHCQRIIYFIEK